MRDDERLQNGGKYAENNSDGNYGRCMVNDILKVFFISACVYDSVINNRRRGLHNGNPTKTRLPIRETIFVITSNATIGVQSCELDSSIGFRGKKDAPSLRGISSSKAAPSSSTISGISAGRCRVSSFLVIEA